jgi:hypothetical protein
VASTVLLYYIAYIHLQKAARSVHLTRYLQHTLILEPQYTVLQYNDDTDEPSLASQYTTASVPLRATTTLHCTLTAGTATASTLLPVVNSIATATANATATS